MKATVYVRLKKEVLDPQGEAIKNALLKLGFEGVKGVRVGKLIEIELSPESNSEEKLKENLKKMADSESTPYTAYMTSLLQTSEPPLPDLSAAARQLHISERTLNRRLQEEGCNFRDLKSNALAAWAKLYLAQTDQSVDSIAAALGYQDTANFRRAFRKSEGRSPNEYRLSCK